MFQTTNQYNYHQSMEWFNGNGKKHMEDRINKSGGNRYVSSKEMGVVTAQRGFMQL